MEIVPFAHVVFLTSLCIPADTCDRPTWRSADRPMVELLNRYYAQKTRPVKSLWRWATRPCSCFMLLPTLDSP